MTVVVRGGTVVTPEGARPADVVIDGERIVAVVDPGTAHGDVIDAAGLVVLPGMVDAHVHFDEPGRTDWEGFDTGSAAAAAGGVTTVVDMPIDCDPPTITAEAVRMKQAAAVASSRVDVALWGGLVPGAIERLDAMAALGVVGLKAFACPSGWDEFPPADEETLRAGARLGLPIAVHCELAPLGRTIESEVSAVRWAAGIVTAAGAPLHVVHVSSAAAVDEARRWPGVTVETCVHYLVLDAPGDPLAHCFPPIRTPAERQALWDQVVRGRVDTIASDHSPCPPALKAADPPWAGVDGVGMTIPLLLSDCDADLETVARLTTAAARLLRLAHKGAIAPGYDADLALVDLSHRWVATTYSRHRQSPYAGRLITGRVVRTLVRGRTVWEVGEGVCEPGGGAIVRPRL